ncbi:hypothetical protein NDU88_002926 [Pleurodeles waltl]|uniref:Uncharacterized protein n=1 Tax=Pleurodeles waltl TaxID=8319 RepID=A0AAV7UEE7_PLEWA|nr:hypothetical protein NDU88_002926 [Pleurodeles waltl]
MPRGRCVEILGMQEEVTGAALIRWAMPGNFCRTAGTASTLLAGSRAASFWFSFASIQGAVRRISGCSDAAASFSSLGSRAASIQFGVLWFSHHNAGCASFLAGCASIFAEQGVLLQKISLFGPETSGNRRQALSRPLESTSQQSQRTVRQQGNNRAAVLCRKAVR